MRNLSLSLLVFFLHTANICFSQSPTEHALTPDGSTWFVIRDFGQRPEPINLGTGSFLSFQSRNGNQKWGDWVFLNGGLLDLTDSVEQADLDLVIYIDGRPSGIALQGRVGGNNPALFPMYDGEIDIGRKYSSFRNMFLSGNVYLPRSECPNSVSSAVLRKNGCLKVIVSGEEGYIPIYR